MFSVIGHDDWRKLVIGGGGGRYVVFGAVDIPADGRSMLLLCHVVQQRPLVDLEIFLFYRDALTFLHTSLLTRI